LARWNSSRYSEEGSLGGHPRFACYDPSLKRVVYRERFGSGKPSQGNYLCICGKWIHAAFLVFSPSWENHGIHFRSLVAGKWAKNRIGTSGAPSRMPENLTIISDQKDSEYSRIISPAKNTQLVCSYHKWICGRRESKI
jgi:hypothetical protein